MSMSMIDNMNIMDTNDNVMNETETIPTVNSLVDDVYEIIVKNIDYRDMIYMCIAYPVYTDIVRRLHPRGVAYEISNNNGTIRSTGESLERFLKDNQDKINKKPKPTNQFMADMRTDDIDEYSLSIFCVLENVDREMVNWTLRHMCGKYTIDEIYFYNFKSDRSMKFILETRFDSINFIDCSFIPIHQEYNTMNNYWSLNDCRLTSNTLSVYFRSDKFAKKFVFDNCEIANIEFGGIDNQYEFRECGLTVDKLIDLFREKVCIVNIHQNNGLDIESDFSRSKVNYSEICQGSKVMKVFSRGKWVRYHETWI